MKNITLAASLFCLLLSAGACKKNHTEVSQDAHSIIRGAYQKIPGVVGGGEIALVNDLTQTRFGEISSQYHFEGTLADGDSYGEAVFNNYTIQVNGNAFEMSSAVDTPALKGNEGNYFGTVNEIRLGGNILTSDFYVPQPVQLSFDGSDGLDFSQAGGISFSFSADPGNNNPVIVVLEHLPQGAGPGMVANTKTFSFPPGTTSGSIPASDLSDFPINEDLTLYAGSGNEMNFTLNGKTYTVTGLNITYIPGIRLH